MIELQDFLEMQREIGILRKNVRDLQRQLQEAFLRIKELGEKHEPTRRED